MKNMLISIKDIKEETAKNETQDKTRKFEEEPIELLERREKQSRK